MVGRSGSRASEQTRMKKRRTTLQLDGVSDNFLLQSINHRINHHRRRHHVGRKPSESPAESAERQATALLSYVQAEKASDPSIIRSRAR